MGSLEAGAAPRVRPAGAVRGRRKRILVVNAFFDDLRRETASPYKVPQSMAPFYLAGAFHRERCDVRVYSEHHGGPLDDPALLAWPDMLVLTALNVAFDRMLHLTAYARSRNASLVVVAGGHAVRALPERARRFFDYVCTGDVEQIREVVTEVFGAGYVAEDITPRYDLFRRNDWLGYAETSRNCNFRCNFCTLTGERNGYYKYDLEDIRRHLIAMGRKRHVLFLDNNFYGGDQGYFRARMALLRELRREGRLGTWSAMVTNDFFAKEENVRLAREAGCRALFSGVESFDPEVLRGIGKRQNLVLPQLEIIYRCLEAGIMFHYGMIFDLATRRIDDIRREIEIFLDTPGITLPSFVSLTIPLLGTPYFEQCIREKMFLPNVRLRDVDGFTLTLEPLDGVEAATRFVRDLPSLGGYRARVWRKALEVLWRHARRMDRLQLTLTSANPFLLCAPGIINARLRVQRRQRPKRTYVSTTEPLDPLYTPRFPLESRFRDHFVPTMVTDDEGRLAEDMLLDYHADGSRVTALAPVSRAVEPAI